tara:strand:+ start:14069 stop:14335 length:267 start_codon:yes stop_codon:yes gene_type:complete
MSLTIEQKDTLMATRSIVVMYDMAIFAVDYIKDVFETDDPFVIGTKLEEYFEIHLTLEEIIKLTFLDDSKKLKPSDYSCSMSEIFNKC